MFVRIQFRLVPVVVVAWLLALPAVSLAASLEATDGEHFERRVRPLLVTHCVECHGPEKQEAGLRVDSRGSLLKGGESGPALVPGNPGQSLLVSVLQGGGTTPRMPSKRAPLSPAAVAEVAAWVASGAPWPSNVVVSPVKFDLEARKRDLPWIWTVPSRQVVPRIAGGAGLSPVDCFIREKLGAAGLQPAPRADARTWYRRACQVLTGLPPAPEAVAQFVRECGEPGSDPVAVGTERARELAVDRLLASPYFGERWARHWMDVMRYAESRGHEDDFVIANAWRYRDYLVRAFNADVPYDRFVSEHVAGDLLEPRRDPETGGNESVLGTGWAFLGEEVHSPVDIRQDECERVDNKVDVLSKAFLGLTVACARCHDHKFDALTQQDYYALSGFILGSPYRQVRYRTAEADAATARELALLREREAGRVTQAFARAVEPGVRGVRDLLEAAVGDPGGAPAGGLASAWRDELGLARTNAQHALHRLARVLAGDAVVGGPERVPLPGDARVWADFTRAGATAWRVDGPAFGLRPRRAGEVLVGDGERLLAGVMREGAARRDPFWDRLALEAGTEMDSGSLGAAGRAGRTLLTPKFTLGVGRLHYLMRGRAQVYAGVDTHIMVNGPLHGRLVGTFDSGGGLRWVTHDLGEYAGHRAHLEFAPRDGAGLELLMVVESSAVPTWLPTTAWAPSEPATGRAEWMTRFQDDLQSVCRRFASGVGDVPVGMAPLADWLVRNGSLFGVEPGWTNGCAALMAGLEKLASGVRWESPTAVAWTETSGVDERVLVRGNPGKPAELAPRGLPAAFGYPRIETRDRSGRLELAGQLVDGMNPLVARVLVNRVWHHVFGRGLVGTVDNFGVLGERPSHPELLDHLAWMFQHEDGWSVKRLLRRLILTETFAQASRAGDARALEVDPTNRLLHRMPVRRLEAEAIRDALLAVAGRLSLTQGGPPVPVHLTEFIVGRGRPGTSGPLDGGGRRSLYVAVRRNFLPTLMVAFDYPTPFSTVGRRNVTNVPGQNLVLMNDPFVWEQAGRMALRMLSACRGSGDAARVDWLFELALGRPAAEEEQSAATALLGELRRPHGAGEVAEVAEVAELAVWGEFCHALLNANEFIYLK